MQPAPAIFSPLFGLVMVAAAAAAVGDARGVALVAALLAVVSVLTGVLVRPAATLAVVLAASVIVLSDPPTVFAALSGLCAAAYLVLRHAVGGPAGVVTTTPPTVIGAVGFTLAGLAATSFPLQLPWLPLLAPLAIIGIYVLATRPFMGGRKGAQRAE